MWEALLAYLIDQDGIAYEERVFLALGVFRVLVVETMETDVQVEDHPCSKIYKYWRHYRGRAVPTAADHYDIDYRKQSYMARVLSVNHLSLQVSVFWS